LDPIVVAQALNLVFEVTTLVVIVLGLAIVFGFLGVMNLAHGEFITVGAYLTAFAIASGWPYLAAVPLTLLVCAALGFVVERVLIRPLYYRPFDTLLATWGLSLLLREIVKWVSGGAYKNVPVPLGGSVAIAGVAFPAYRALLVAISLLVIAALVWWYLRSATGIRIRAMVGNPDLARAVGIPATRLARNTFIAGTCLGGLAGVMIAPLVPVQPLMGLDYILEAFFVLVVGGLGSLIGLVSGSVVIGGVQSAVSAILDRTYGYSAVLLIAILFLWLRPRGIFARA
jgi:branched-chain amino acid transport system permease protein/urea transport system permease protein